MPVKVDLSKLREDLHGNVKIEDGYRRKFGELLHRGEAREAPEMFEVLAGEVITLLIRAKLLAGSNGRIEEHDYLILGSDVGGIVSNAKRDTVTLDINDSHIVNKVGVVFQGTKKR